MNITEFEYYLPHELIAQKPIYPRDAARLMVLYKDSGQIENKHILDIVDYLNPGDLVVLNDTKVIPARLMGHKETGGVVEVLLLEKKSESVWEALVSPGRRIHDGTRLIFGKGDLTARVLERVEEGARIIEFSSCNGFIEKLIHIYGRMPLPPYITEELADQSRYQTIYARDEGSAAAPTAGLHFTERLFSRLTEKGVEIAYVTLHVGLGTFRPVKVDNIEAHHMHEETIRVTCETADKINSRKGNLLAVGTTTVRTLESAADDDGIVHPVLKSTSLYIKPGYKFKIVDRLMTNFHLPKSSLLVMISALAGREKVLHAYDAAVRENYRFFSFGDAMLII